VSAGPSVIARFRNPWGRARFLWVVTGAYIAWSLVPVLIAIRISFNEGRSLVDFRGWSLTWWWSHPTLSAWHRPELHSALFQSVRLAALTMLVAVPLGVAFAIALDRWRGPLPGSANLLMALSWVTPELIIGVALFLVFAHLLRFITFGTWAQALGLITFEMTYPVIIVRARLLTLGRQYEEAAQDLGASPMRSIWRVVLPLLSPAIVAAAMIVFVDAIDDFVVAAWLSGGASSETVAIRIYSDARGSVTPALNALGSMMLLTTMVFLVIGGLIYRRLARRTRIGQADSLTDFVASQA
jgi:spermidine/putrescine transport system permease protein